MADVGMPSQLQQWGFDKTMGRPERADSAASSPELFTAADDGIAPHAPKSAAAPKLDTASDALFQHRYLSSEEDLSPMEPDFGDSDLDESEVIELVEATAVPAALPTPVMAQRPKSGDMAVTVSYVSAGRPKIVDVPTLAVFKERPSRTSSLAASHTMPELATLARLSLSNASTISASRASKDASRRRSISFGKVSSYCSATTTSTVAAAAASAHDMLSRTDSQTAASLCRPSTSKSFAHYTNAARNSFHLLASKSSTNVHDGVGLPSPSPTPSAPSFLNSDPFSEGSTNAASPTIKSGHGHKRLRSISRSLALAKIAITKPKSGGGSLSTPTEIRSPFGATTPRTPMTPEAPRSATSNRRRLVQRVESMPPPMPTEPPPAPPSLLQRARPKLVPRGASERSPTLDLPPFPADEAAKPANPSRMSRLKKRKSMLGLA